MVEGAIIDELCFVLRNWWIRMIVSRSKSGPKLSPKRAKFKKLGAYPWDHPRFEDWSTVDSVLRPYIYLYICTTLSIRLPGKANAWLLGFLASRDFFYSSPSRLPSHSLPPHHICIHPGCPWSKISTLEPRDATRKGNARRKDPPLFMIH